MLWIKQLLLPLIPSRIIPVSQNHRMEDKNKQEDGLNKDNTDESNSYFILCSGKNMNLMQ